MFAARTARSTLHVYLPTIALKDNKLSVYVCSRDGRLETTVTHAHGGHHERAVGGVA